jgi:hypothetical protein
MRQVVLTAFPQWTAQFEGSVLFFYKDVKGLVTIGEGNLVDPLPPGLDFGPAAPGDVLAAWQRVKYDTTLDPRNGGGQYARLTTVRMTPSGVAQLVFSKLEQMEAVVRQYFPNWSTAPAHAQLAVMSHCWAFGPHFPSSWPHLTQAFNLQAYQVCAAQCVPSAAEMSVQNDSFHRRIAAEQAHFLACLTDPDPDSLVLS